MAVMLDPKVKEKMQLGYAKVGDLGYQIALNLKKGKDHVGRQKDLWDRGIKIWQLLKLLYRHVDITTTPVTLKGITPTKVNKLLLCLEKLGDLDTLPVVPSLVPSKRATVINKGQDGTPGAPGKDGSNAYIGVFPEIGETNVSVREAISGDYKNYFIAVDLYTPPTIELAVTAPKVYMKGTVLELKNLTITTKKGNKNIQTLTIVTPPELNTEFQAGLNFSTINGETQPVQNVFGVANLAETTTFKVRVSDGIESAEVEDKVEFFLPFFHGAVPSTSFSAYSSLTKTVSDKGDLFFDFDDEDKYFVIGYPSSYGEARIKDENQDDVTASFNTYLEEVTSTGLDEDWTEEYRFYITTHITDITGRFQLIFNS